MLTIKKYIILLYYIFYKSITVNETPVCSENDYIVSNVAYHYNKSKYPTTTETELKKFIKNKNTIIEEILEYNYQKFTNGQLVIAIISLVIFSSSIANFDE